jgi:hypothetical protein
MIRSRLAAGFLALLVVGGCSTFDTIKHVNIGSEFEKSSRAYVQLIRWHELESAMATYVGTPLRADYQKRITEAGETKVVDYRITSMACDPVKGEATLTVEYDYYRLPSTRVLTVVDHQKWSYVEQAGVRAWQLQTLLPSFK